MRAWTPTSARRTTSSATSTAAGWRRPRSPRDRSSWGPFVQLADAAEEHVRAIIEELAARVAAGEGASTTTRARSATSTPPSWTRPPSTSSAPRPIRPLHQRGRRAARRPRPGRLPRRVRADRRQRPVRLLRRHRRPNSDRYLFNLAPGRPRAARRVVLPRRQVRRDPREVRRLPRPACSRSAGHADAGGRRRDRARASTPGSPQGHWERAETRDVQKTYNLHHARRARGAVPGLRLGRLRHQPRRHRRDDRRGLRAPAVVLRAPLRRCSTRCRSSDWQAWLLVRVLRSAAPYLTDDFVETNFDFYGRTLTGTPELRARWKRGVALVEGAMGEAVGKEYVARHFPPRSKALMDDLVANLLAAYRQLDRAARLDDRGDQGAGLREAATPSAPRSATPRSSATTPRSQVTPRRPDGQRRSGRGVRDRPRSWPRSARRSTATSGSCCRRPSTPTTTPAPTRSASRPASCRSRSSAPTPTRPRTTAASARSSATRSATASTTRARSTTAPATSTTGGPPTTRPPSR